MPSPRFLSAVALFPLLALAVAGPISAQTPTLADTAFQKLRERPPLHPDCFEFVLIGDTRSAEPVVLPEVFRQSIREWNILQPAFVIDAGDLVLGGAADGLEPQWREFKDTVARSEAPFIPVVGNHDVSDPATEKIYVDQVGPLTFGFSYGNSRFIALNSEEQGAVDTFSEPQLQWLADELERSTETNIFLFMHKPYFDGDWDRQWARVAEIMRGHPVKVVFGSHWHLYRYAGQREGVHYVVSGGGGADTTTPEEEGGFFHYLYVQVRGDQVSWSVVRPGSILPIDTVTRARIDELRALREMIGTETLEVAYGKTLDREISLWVGNPYGEALNSKLAWTVPEGWTISPLEKEYSVEPGAQAQLRFRLAAASAEAVRFPVPAFTTQIDIAKNGGPIVLNEGVDLVPLTTAPRAPQTISIDGDLGEWGAAPALPLSYGWEFDVRDVSDLEAKARLMWDEANVYLGVETYDDEFHQPYGGDIVWSADNVQLFLDQYEWGLSLTPKGEEVFLYKAPTREGETVNTAVQLKVRRSGNRIVYEAAFPAAELAPLPLRAGESMRFSVVMNDLDPGVPDRPRHWAELTPGAGMGGARFPRVKVVFGE